MRMLRLGAAAILSLGLVAGCATAPPEVVLSPIADTASPTPTPTPTPHLTAITLNADAAVATDQNGQVLASLDYYGRGVDLAATLTQLFGFAPTVEVIEPANSDVGFSGTIYEWEGLVLRWRSGYETDPASGTGHYPFGPSINITALVASVRGVTVQGPDGVTVGTGQGDLAARYPETVRFDDDGVMIENAMVACVDLPGSESTSTYAPRNCVALRAAPADGPITGIQAPAADGYGY